MGTHERCPGRPSAPRATTCRESVTQDTPADLRTLPTALHVLARRLLAGTGLVLAFWAFTALSQAHADVLPSHSSTTPRPLLHVKPPTTAGSGTHALSHTLGGLTARTGTGTGRPVSRIVSGARKTALGTVRKPAALVHATVPATRARLDGLSRDLGLPDIVRRPRAIPLPSVPDAIGVAKTGTTRVVHPPSSSACDDDRDCDPLELQPPRSPTPSAAQGPVRAPPIGVRTQSPRPGPGETGDEPVMSRMKLTGTIVAALRRPDVRPGLRPPVPVPVPASGAGSGGDSGGKTSSSGAGDVAHFRLSAPGLWSLANEPETTISRTIADKPPFSPD